ncbi:hypothetical protein JIN84_22460 [Luteolibacter yonseiensis]|uniref:Uncharacterized protein n=1 Tax=Luteolibacter yonseiensis TaxID=1144680 RepID=A0A934R7G9_9BACT|nr:hypothetical protein [Luteolibacter yonseiensis]MBK1818399.1 hypothetical protein [Luteolibacter yonseiensis]
MNSTPPTRESRHPRGIIQVALAAAIAITPILIKSHLDDNAQAAIAREYDSSRNEVLSRIDTAVRNHDLATLRGIESRYGGSVNDPEFKSVLNAGMAKVTARETEIELLISKHLDLVRHKEEVSFRPNPRQPQIAREDHQGAVQQLSILPH